MIVIAIIFLMIVMIVIAIVFIVIVVMPVVQPNGTHIFYCTIFPFFRYLTKKPKKEENVGTI